MLLKSIINLILFNQFFSHFPHKGVRHVTHKTRTSRHFIFGARSCHFHEVSILQIERLLDITKYLVYRKKIRYAGIFVEIYQYTGVILTIANCGSIFGLFTVITLSGFRLLSITLTARLDMTRNMFSSHLFQETRSDWMTTLEGHLAVN